MLCLPSSFFFWAANIKMITFSPSAQWPSGLLSPNHHWPRYEGEGGMQFKTLISKWKSQVKHHTERGEASWDLKCEGRRVKQTSSYFKQFWHRWNMICVQTFALSEWIKCNARAGHNLQGRRCVFLASDLTSDIMWLLSILSTCSRGRPMTCIPNQG